MTALCAVAFVSHAGAQSALSPRQEKLFFAGVVGENPRGGMRVLLRWYGMEAPVSHDRFAIYRKTGDKSSPAPLQRISIVTPIRNINTIRSLFERQGEEAILEDILELLGDVYGDTVTLDTYAQKLIDLLEADGCEACGFTAATLAQFNYGAAIVSGVGYLDDVAPGIYTYELRMLDAAGNEIAQAGRITVDANQPTLLPPPQNAREVILPGARGHRVIYLKWDITPELIKNAPLSFGYNVYRLAGSVPSGQSFESLLAASQLTRVNPLPVIVLSATPEGENPDEVYYFADDGRTIGKDGPEGEPFMPGEVYTYWVTARDLLGQRGRPSNAREVTVRDQFAPDVPRGVECARVPWGAQEHNELRWTANAAASATEPDDTAQYLVYRYRLYQNAGRKGPFAPVDGLTEGLIDTVPHPGPGLPVFYLDTEINAADHESAAFWYCIEAVDAAGNGSGLSPPVRCVLYDRVPPAPIPPDLICVSTFECRATSSLVSLRQDNELLTRVVVEIHRQTRLYRSVELYAVLDNNTLEQTPFFQAAFGDSNQLEARLVYDIREKNIDNIALFAMDFEGRRCGPFGLDRQLASHLGKRSIEVRFRFALNAGREKRDRCQRGQDAGDITHVPGDTLDPVRFRFPLPTDDAIGIILYRSADCERYEPVCEATYELAFVECLDYFNPITPSRVCYAARTFDRSRNLSPFYYFPFQVKLPGNLRPLTPAVRKATPAGDSTLPVAQVEWVGSRDGVAAYHITFATDIVHAATAPRYISRWPISSLAYDESKNLFTASVRYVDTDTARPVELNQVYDVKVVAIEENDDQIESLNSKLFVWTDELPPEELMAWPIRPLPVGGLPLLASSTAHQTPGAKAPPGIYLFMGFMAWQYDQRANEWKVNRSNLLYPHPFVLYRKRTDISNADFVQISPLISEIKIADQGRGLNDPFFFARFINDTVAAIFYVDDVALVRNATYKYQLLDYTATGELRAVHGDSNEATWTP